MVSVLRSHPYWFVSLAEIGHTETARMAPVHKDYAQNTSTSAQRIFFFDP